MSKDNLYTPSLESGETRKTESYELGRLFYPAFIGGTIALTGLALTNARTLRLNPRLIAGLAVLALLLFIGKMYAYNSYFEGTLHIQRQALKYIARAGDLLLFAVFYGAMKKSYQAHLLLHGETKKMWKPAIAWCAVSMIVEFTLISFMIPR